MRHMNSQFSDELEACLGHRDRLTVGDLTEVLDERSFALVVMVLMVPSALPVPTGGVTHLLQLAAMLVTLQMIVGRRELWLPRRLRDHELGSKFREKGIPAVIRRVRWVERFARPRLTLLVESRVGASVIGVLALVFEIAAFVAPPFSGLDTLPSLGVVVLCLGLLFADGVIVAAGVVAGSTGIALEILLGKAALSLI
jgi:hypothetical protein